MKKKIIKTVVQDKLTESNVPPVQSIQPDKSAFILPGPLRDYLVNYLSSKPFREVADVMNALRELQPVHVSPTAADSTS